MKRKWSPQVIAKTELRQECFDQREVSVGKWIFSEVYDYKLCPLKKLDQRALIAKLRAFCAPKGGAGARGDANDIGKRLGSRDDDQGLREFAVKLREQVCRCIGVAT